MKNRKPKKYTTRSSVVFYLFCMTLILIRWMSIFNDEVMVMNQEINSHITNFTLSTLLCVFFGFLFLTAGKSYRSTLWVGLLIVLANFGYEMFFSLLNTRDLMDAIYGLVGVGLSFIYLYFISRYGFKDV